MYARLIEILTCLERIEIALDDPDLQSDHLRARADVNQLEAVGVSEAPRGTLFTTIRSTKPGCHAGKFNYRHWSKQFSDEPSDR